MGNRSNGDMDSIYTYNEPAPQQFWGEAIQAELAKVLDITFTASKTNNDLDHCQQSMDYDTFLNPCFITWNSVALSLAPCTASPTTPISKLQQIRNTNVLRVTPQARNLTYWGQNKLIAILYLKYILLNEKFYNLLKTSLRFVLPEGSMIIHYHWFR